jgi:hypothetical protein
MVKDTRKKGEWMGPYDYMGMKIYGNDKYYGFFSRRNGREEGFNAPLVNNKTYIFKNISTNLKGGKKTRKNKRHSKKSRSCRSKSK